MLVIYPVKILNLIGQTITARRREVECTVVLLNLSSGNQQMTKRREMCSDVIVRQ